MAEEKNATTEMSPTEDGTKVPLNNEKHVDEEAKYVANENGDAKIDIGTANTFSGLTKEELLKYSSDPFWVRLRWFLFILFWAGWVAMLVMAIVIIIQAPGCQPPPVRYWVEENPLYQVDTSNLPTGEELLPSLKNVGLSAVYLPNLIDEKKFNMSNYNADSLINFLKENKIEIATDLPRRMTQENPLYRNASDAGVLDASGRLTYHNENWTSVLATNALDIWIERGVKGFLLDNITKDNEKFVKNLNKDINDRNGAVSGRIVNMNNETWSSPKDFKDFLMSHSSNWTFYQFNPVYEATPSGSGLRGSRNSIRLMNIAMYAFKGTPLLLNINESNDMEKKLLTELKKEFRPNNGMKFGEVNFANSSDDVISFTRVQKGTPAYAIALNFGNETQTVQFNGTANIGDVGTVKLDSEPTVLNDEADMRRKVPLNNVEVKGYEGLIIEFVANF